MDVPDPVGPAPRASERAAIVLRDWRVMLMLISCGVMVFVVVTVIGFSGAYFTSESTSPGNEFAAGSIDIDLTSSGPLLDGTGLYPGQTRTGTQTITSLQHAASVTLSVEGLPVDVSLAEVLVVTVEETDPKAVQLYTGP